MTPDPPDSYPWSQLLQADAPPDWRATAARHAGEAERWLAEADRAADTPAARFALDRAAIHAQLAAVGLDLAALATAKDPR